MTFIKLSSKTPRRGKFPVGFLVVMLMTSSLSVSDASARSTLSSEELEIVDLVRSGMYAGLVQLDQDSYKKIFAENAVFIRSRTAEIDAYSETLPVQKVLVFMEKTKPKESFTKTFDVTDVKVEIKGNTAQLRWSVNQVFSRGFMRFGAERYGLIRSKEGWLVTENQYWVLSQGNSEFSYALDTEFWVQRDADVATARKTKDRTALVTALYAAERYPELVALLSSIPDSKKTAEIWMYEANAHSKRADFEPARKATCASLRAGKEMEKLPPVLVKTCDSVPKQIP